MEGTFREGVTLNTRIDESKGYSTAAAEQNRCYAMVVTGTKLGDLKMIYYYSSDVAYPLPIFSPRQLLR